MKKSSSSLIALLGIFLFFNLAFAARGLAISGLRANDFMPAQEIKKVKLDKKTGENSWLTCYRYARFAVLEYDTGEKGATRLSVRYPKNNNAVIGLCQNKFNGQELSLSDVDGYFEGAIDQYIFVTSADSFGGIMKISAYDALTGKKVFTTDYHLTQGIQLTSNSHKIALTFYRPIKTSCVPVAENLNCWKRILQENSLASVKIMAPDCKRLLNMATSAVQISVKVRVDDVMNGQIKYLRSPAICDLVP